MLTTKQENTSYLRPTHHHIHAFDWLRVVALLLLFFYHTGMLYVADWGFHIKSTYSSEALTGVMLMVNPWRMSLLWFISGVALRFVVDKYPVWSVLKQRSIRLLLPLTVGVWLIVPPQLYFEMQYKGDLSMSFVEFMAAFFDLQHPAFEKYPSGIWPHVDVNHLWYLRELWLFSIPVILLGSFWDKCVTWLEQTPFLSKLINSAFLWLCLLVVATITLDLSLERPREEIGFCFLLVGFAIAKQEKVLAHFKQYFLTYLVLYMLSASAVVVGYYVLWLDDSAQQFWKDCLTAVYRGNGVLAVAGLLGLSLYYFNKPSRLLDWLSERVFPLYLFHQTFIIVVAAWLKPYSLGGVVEALAVLFLSLLASLFCCELAKHSGILRPIFGYKQPVLSNTSRQVRYEWLLFLLAMPIAVQLLI